MTDEDGQTKLDELLRRQGEYENSMAPLDVAVLLGDKVVQVRLPYLKGRVFAELADKHSPHVLYRDAVGCWFNIDDVARDYPGVMVIDGEHESDLYVIRDKAAVYRWPEVYDALGGEDKYSIQAGIWGFYVHEPAERKRKAVAQNG